MKKKQNFTYRCSGEDLKKHGLFRPLLQFSIAWVGSVACTFGATAATSIGWNVGRLGHRVAGVVLSSLLFLEQAPLKDLV